MLSGFGVSQVFCRRWLAVTGTAGILGACTGFHAIYNLLITAEGGWRMAGYLFLSALLAVLAILSKNSIFSRAAGKFTVEKLSFFRQSVF